MTYEFSIDEPQSISYIADWIELYITANKTSLSKSEVQSNIESAQGYEPEETLIDTIWNELERRELLYGRNAPFKLEERSISFNELWIERKDYLMCLVLSLFGNGIDTTRTGTLFEKVSEKAVRKYLHSKETVLYGTAPRPPLQQIIGRMFERYKASPPSFRQDRKADIIAWKPFGDKRSSQIIILFQCAAGNDWKAKINEVCLPAWATYANWGSYLMKGFCLPKLISREEFEEYSLDGGLLLDRARICRNTIIFDNELKQEIKNWCSSMLDYHSISQSS